MRDIKKIVCNYDNKHGHIKSEKMKQKDMNPCKCTNQNICQLNPLPSRYKETLNEKEEGTPIQQKYQCQTLVKCTQEKCKNYNTDHCKHSKPHLFTSECLVLCERYPNQICEAEDRVTNVLCVQGYVTEYLVCKECENNTWD